MIYKLSPNINSPDLVKQTRKETGEDRKKTITGKVKVADLAKEGNWRRQKEDYII